MYCLDRREECTRGQRRPYSCTMVTNIGVSSAPAMLGTGCAYMLRSLGI